jgi:hypothetical protein
MTPAMINPRIKLKEEFFFTSLCCAF